MKDLKIEDLFKIDYFNYWLLSEICDYLFDDISNGKCYLTNWVSSCNLLNGENENFEKFYMSILAKKGMYLYPIRQIGSYSSPLDNCMHPYLYRSYFMWKLPIENSRILDDSQRRAIQNLDIRTIISDMSWSKGVHKHFINISGAIGTLYLGIVNHKQDLKTDSIHSDENLIVDRICNKFNGDVNLELTIDCDVGKLYAAKEGNKKVFISKFTPNERVHLGARFGNWGVKAVVKKSYYFIS